MALFEERTLRLKSETGEALEILDRDLAGITLDPYLLWACETQFTYYKSQALPNDTEARLLIELTAEGAAGGAGSATLAKLDAVSIADIYTSPALHLLETHFLTARVKLRAFLVSLRDSPELRALIKGLTLSMLISPEEEECHPKGKSALWAEGFKPEKYQELCKTNGTKSSEVIVAVVDDGIALLNERFCHRSIDNNQTTRFISYWDQNSPPRQGGYGQSASAAYGQVFDREAINNMLNSPHAATHMYRKEQLYRLDRGQSHGTAVLDIAAGSPIESGSDAPKLLAVQLQLPRSGDDNSGGWLDGALLDALRFTLDQVDSFWANLVDKSKETALPQLVVNVSFSTQRGAHDGNSAITRAIDELITSRLVNGRHTLAVVFSAGNELQSQQHVDIPIIKPGDSKDMLWQIPPDDDTPSFVELWARGEQPDFSVMLIPPGETNKPSVHLDAIGTQSHARDTSGNIIASAIANAKQDTDQCCALLALPPTNRREFGGAKANFGTWTIRVCNTSNHPLSLNGWIQADRSRQLGPSRGRQSYFYDNQYRKRVNSNNALKSGIPPGSFETSDQFKSQIKRSNTLNALATGQYSLSAAGYLHDTGDYADYAALGKGGWNKGPDVATVCQLDKLKGMPTSGTLSGAYTQINGTSAAAPALTRRLAAQWQSQPELSAQTALQQMIEQDRAEINQRYQKPLNPNGQVIERLLPYDESNF